MHAGILSIGKMTRHAEKLLSKVLWNCALEDKISLPKITPTLGKVIANLVQRTLTCKKGRGSHGKSTTSLYSGRFRAYPNPGVKISNL